MRRMNKRKSRRMPLAKRRARRRWPDLRFWEWLPQNSVWRRRLTLASGGLTVLAVLLGGMYWFNQADIPSRMAAAIRTATIDATKWAGFSVRAVYVEGRKESSREQLIGALNLAIGDSIFEFDPAEAQSRLEKLGWVAEARIERHLPDAIHIYLKERKPIAIWQRKKKFVLVDKSGAVIGQEGLSRYGDLKIIVGDGAPAHAADLLSMMEAAPKMMERVTHAVWVGGRRWNIRMEDAIDIRMPAENPENAWRKLTEMEREFGLLKRDIIAVDLRIPDRMTVRKNPRKAKISKTDGRT